MKKQNICFTIYLAAILIALLAAPSFAQTEFLEKGESSVGFAGGYATAEGVNASGITGYISLISFIDISYTKGTVSENGSSSDQFTSTGVELFFARNELNSGEMLFSLGAVFDENQEIYFGAVGYSSASNADKGKTAGEILVGQITVNEYSAIMLGASIGTSVRHKNLMMIFTANVARVENIMSIGATIAISGVLKRY